MKNLLPAIQIIAITIVIWLSIGCTKLDAELYDQSTTIGNSTAELEAGIGSVYAGLRSYAPVGAVYCLNEISTDEIIVPDRVTNWVDDGTWSRLWKHAWTPNHPFVRDAWQFIYAGIARVNNIMHVLATAHATLPGEKTAMAQLRAIRAFYYFLAIDLFGDVPILEPGNYDLSKLGNQPRATVFNYAEKELKEVLADLPKENNLSTYGRPTFWFAQALLAKLYLNAEVYSGTAKWNECVAACDDLLHANIYILEPDFFSNFKVANENSVENIFVIPFDIAAGLASFSIQVYTLHYVSSETFDIAGYFGGGGYNGFCSTAEYLRLFSANDKRRNMFLTGQQYVHQIPDSNHLQYDGLGYLLNFDPEITSFKILPPKTEGAGARCAKWEFNKEFSDNMNNDFALFRLSDIILMKAEAQFRLGNTSATLETLNYKTSNGVSIRSRAGMPAFTMADINADSLLAERAREFSWEGWRRNDMIRLGHYTDKRIPEKESSANYRKLFPIPQNQLDQNSWLKQNPGY